MRGVATGEVVAAGGRGVMNVAGGGEWLVLAAGRGVSGCQRWCW